MENLSQVELEEMLKTPHSLTEEQRQQVKDTLLKLLVTVFWDDTLFLRKVNAATFGIIKVDNTVR